MDMYFKCPTCGKSLQAPEEKVGIKVLCPGCKGQLQVPPAEMLEFAEEAPPVKTVVAADSATKQRQQRTETAPPLSGLDAFFDGFAMSYEVSKTIKKPLGEDDVFRVLEEKVRTSGSISRSGDALLVSGFNNNLGGINYVTTCQFTVTRKDDKTVIQARIRQRLTILFFVFLIVGLFAMVVAAAVPVVFFFLGKNFVIQAVDRALNETAEELG